MKKILTLVIMLSVMAFTATQAQNVSMDIYHSTSKMTGINLYKTSQLGFVYGIGASYYFPTYTGETGGKYMEIANRAIPIEASRWGYYAPAFYKNFKENRGTLKALIGYDYGKVAVVVQGGLAFRSEYWCGKGGASPIGDYDPVNKYFYTYRNISPAGLIGASVNYKLFKRWRLYTGWNNIEKVVYGLSYQITPTSWFNWK